MTSLTKKEIGMDGRLFTTPDRIIEAAATFTAEGFERSFAEIIELPAWPERTERPLRAMKPAVRRAPDIATA